MTNFCSLTLVLSALMTVHALPKAGWGSGWGSGTEDCAATSNWPGFEGLKHAFVFGDSYSTTTFNLSGAQPSVSNPLGNPPYPGYTADNGPNWVDYLTTTYNKSLLLTYNLAYGGATIDASLVAPYKTTVLSVSDQVNEEFIPTYGNATFWHGNDTLFLFFDGINDVGNSYGSGSSLATNTAVFAVYGRLVDTVHAAGARNFAFLTTPPVDRSPLTIAAGAAAQALEKADIAEWNAMLLAMAVALKGKDALVNVWVVDANGVFTEVLDDVASFAQTAGLKNTTAFCEAYENGTAAPDTFVASCGVPANQYFWLNSLHPTSPMMSVLGQTVAQTLEGTPTVC